MGKKTLIVVGAIAALAACKKPPTAEELAELEQVKQESAALNRQLTDVETKLIVGRSLVAADADLRQRHQQVSQVACQNLSDHWAGINRFLENQKEKEAKKRHQRVASAESVEHD